MGEAARCGYENPIHGPPQRALNDVMAPVWRESRAIYPSVYLSPQYEMRYQPWEVLQQAATRGVVNESIRLSTVYTNGSAPVIPFYWPLYINGTTAVDRHDLLALLRNTYVPPLSTQLIVWANNGPSVSTLAQRVMRSVDGPVIQHVTAAATACSQEHCSGRGWCDAAAVFETSASPQ